MPPIKVTRQVVLARARSCVAQQTQYTLGAGGLDPLAPTPGKRCDCSGFVAWCYVVSRRLRDVPIYKTWNGGWFETTALVRDLRSPFGFCDEVAGADVRPGDFVVYGDRDGHQGHVAIVSRDLKDPKGAAIIDCSRGSYLRTGDAIQERAMSPTFTAPSRRFGRIAWVLD